MVKDSPLENVLKVTSDVSNTFRLSCIHATCFSQGETLRVACFPVGVQFGTGRQSLMGKTPLALAGLFHSLKGSDLQAFQVKKSGD
ncbi:hypothetical protein [Nostoc sp.]|uniref:hypothetical protein n=1 Tax=Nostoc sp. TaxID=1180 RepID=UPI002FF95D46